MPPAAGKEEENGQAASDLRLVPGGGARNKCDSVSELLVLSWFRARGEEIDRTHDTSTITITGEID
jgi:hypothetical protein